MKKNIKWNNFSSVCGGGKLLLTVNVITYNHEEFIEDCLNSILEQRTNFDYLVRIFDDASTDRTQDICRKFKKNFPKKIELHFANKNLGLINNVFVNSLRSYLNITSPYFLFIEGDDYRLDKYGFQRQIDELERHTECSFCCSRTNVVIGNTLTHSFFPQIKAGIYSSYDIINKPSISYYSSLASRIIRTKYMSIKKDEEYFALVDISQMYYLVSQSPFCFVDEVYAVYRRSGKGNSSGMSILDKCCSESQAIRKIYSYFNDKFYLNLAFLFLVDIREVYYSLFFKPVNNFSSQFNETNTHQLNESNFFYKKRKIIRSIAKLVLPGVVILFTHFIRDKIRLLRKKK